MRILFVDPNTSTPYDLKTLREGALGGTESTMLRVAQVLALHHDVLVAELGADVEAWTDGPLRFLSLDSAMNLNGADAPDVVVVLRKHRQVHEFYRRYPDAAMVLWLANFQRPEVMVKRLWLAQSNCTIIAMSQNHRDQAASLMNHPAAKLVTSPPWNPKQLDVRFIYNAIADDLNPDDTPVNLNKLTLFSKAYKGLPETLAAFERARSQMPDLELYFAGSLSEHMAGHPTLKHYVDPQPGVHMLGRLPQHEILQHVRESLCVFYPQHVFSETFGLVYAEANAVGTPVLAHDIGAAREVLSDPSQLVDGHDIDAVVGKLAAWHGGERPVVRAREEFRATRVAQQWREFLEDLVGGATGEVSAEERAEAL